MVDIQQLAESAFEQKGLEMRSARSSGRAARGLVVGVVGVLGSATLLLPPIAAATTPAGHPVTYRAIGNLARIPFGDHVIGRVPAGRWGEPKDLAGAAVFLASAASDYVHGSILTVDGGWMAR